MPEWINEWMPVVAIALTATLALVSNTILLIRREQNNRLFEIWKDKKAFLDMVVDKTANFWIRYIRSEVEEVNFDFHTELIELATLAPRVYYKEVHKALENFVKVADEIQERLELSSEDAALESDALGEAYWGVFHACQREKHSNPRKEAYYSSKDSFWLNFLLGVMVTILLIEVAILLHNYFPLQNLFFQ